MEYLLKCSSRHCLQNLWPHFVSIGSFRGNWQIAHCKSSSTSFTISSSYPPRDLFAGASAIFSWALTRRMIREWPADQLNWIPSIALGGAEVFLCRQGSWILYADENAYVTCSHCDRYSIFLLPGISRQQTIFLIHLRFLVRSFDGSMVICDCSAAQSAVCLAAAPVYLLAPLPTAAHWHSMAAGATRHFVLLSCKICAEIVVYRMLAVFLNGLNGKNSSRRIVRDIFSVYF